MKKQIRFVILPIIILTLLIAACGNNATPAPTVEPTPIPSLTSTPDPCAPENIEAEVQKIHKYMREFDDGSSLAASVPSDQLSDSIAELQRIRREAEDQPTPACLVTLKTYQISHMNIVIGTLINLIGYANGTVSKDVIDQGIALARQEHDKYTIELARVLGLTMVPVSPPSQPSQTPSP
ncbi:MAG: hypothetical protein HXY35_12000 [Chloroflexi bacterium]|nr:hypothetical protein [Chloroflexota bacterium]